MANIDIKTTLKTQPNITTARSYGCWWHPHVAHGAVYAGLRDEKRLAPQKRRSAGTYREPASGKITLKTALRQTQCRDHHQSFH
jgi:hypothetical protein